MSLHDINTSGWREGVAYNKYDPIYFKRSLANDGAGNNFFSIMALNHWTVETGYWWPTNPINDALFSSNLSIKTHDVPFITHITGDHILSSPPFAINPLSNYEASVYVARKDESINTENNYRRDVLNNGAGLRVTFYDSAGDKIWAGVNLIKTHKLVEVNKLPTTGWQSLKLELPYREIPQFGNVAVSGSLDLVVYGQKKGPVYFSGAKIYNTDEYHYATEAHTSSLADSPTGVSSKWTQNFQHTPSYNSSVSFQSNNAASQYGDGYYRIIQKGTNALQMQANLTFEARTDEETKSILHFLKNKKGYKPFFFTMPDPYNKELPYFCEEYDYVKTYTNNNTITANFVNDIETILTKANIFLSSSVAKNRYLDWTPQNYSVNDVAFFETYTNVSGASVDGSPTDDRYATGDENYYYKKSNLPNVESIIGSYDSWISGHVMDWMFSNESVGVTQGWFYQIPAVGGYTMHSAGRWIYAVSAAGNTSFIHDGNAWELVNEDIPYFWETGVHVFREAEYSEGMKSDESLTPDINDNWTKDFFFWKPSLGMAIQKTPRITKSDVKDRFTLRGEGGLNEDQLTLDASFNNRSDSEAAAILHFLEQRRGYKGFKFLPPEPYGQKVVYTGVNTVITGDRSLYNTVNAGDDLLFTDISGGYVDVERKVKSVELISGDLDYNFDHGITKVTLSLGLPSYYDVRGDGTSSGDNRFVVLKNFNCSEWSHNYAFNDNNNIQAKLTETPFKWRAPPDLLIDGDIFVDDGSTVNYTIKGKDSEKIDFYRFYNVNSPVGWGATGTTSFSKSSPITFNTSGLNILRLEARNSLGVYNSVDYDVVVGGDVQASIYPVGGSNYVEKYGALALDFNASSQRFISGVKFWWSDESEPLYTPIQFQNYKLTIYNKYYTGATSVSDSTVRYFTVAPGYGDFTINFKAKDMAGNESSASELIRVLQDEHIARISFKNSNAGVYAFDQRYYFAKTFSNKNFVNSGDLSALVVPVNLTGEVGYGWTHKSTTYSDASKVVAELHYPVGEGGQSGNYFNVSSKLLTTYPSEDTFATVHMECLVTGARQGDSVITGKRDVTFAFSWLVD